MMNFMLMFVGDLSQSFRSFHSIVNFSAHLFRQFLLSFVQVEPIWCCSQFLHVFTVPIAGDAGSLNSACIYMISVISG